MPRRVRWLQFAKAQPILLPESLLPFWNGFYVPAGRIDEFPDLELPDGRAFMMSTEFDFKNPRSDYDRVCGLMTAGRGPVQLIDVGPGHGLALEDGAAGLGWWPDEQVFIGGGRELPPNRDLGALEWTEQVRWEVPDPRVVVTNSCLHGLEEVHRPGQRLVIGLGPGTYTVSAASHPKHTWVSYYRLRRLPRQRARR